MPSTAPRGCPYGEATGITQTVRNYAASLGLAILGTILVSQMRSRIFSSLLAKGAPAAVAHRDAASISQSPGGKREHHLDPPLHPGSTSLTPRAPYSR